MRIAITSGYYDPLHKGHLESMELARENGDALWVIVNNDRQAAIKKQRAFIDENTRVAIVAALRVVDRAVLAEDDDATVCRTLRTLLDEIHAAGHTAVFCKGGDRFATNTPEYRLLRERGVDFVDGLGAKINSSSEIIARATQVHG